MTKKNKPVPYVKEPPKNPGDIWVMTGADWKGIKHASGAYFNPSEVCECSYCDKRRPALKSSIRVIGKLTTKPMCYLCYMNLVCPNDIMTLGNNASGLANTKPHGMRTLKNRHICNNPMGPSKTQWNEYDY